MLTLVWKSALLFLRLEISRQFHAHKDPSGEKGHQDENESHRNQQDLVEFWLSGGMRLIHDYEAKSSDREQETASQTFHDVLTIHSVRHEGNLQENYDD